MDVYMDTFIQETGIPMPNRQTDKNWWWSSVGEYHAIFTQTDRTMEQGIKLIKDAVKELRDKGMVIADPNSLIKTIRKTIGEQNTKAKSRLPSGLTPEQYAAYQKRQAETAKEAWKPD